MKKNILNKASEYALGLLQSGLPSYLHYHNLEHTMNVVDACSQLGYLENLSEEEQNILLAAAWFHDVGYVYDYRDHEGYSIRTARDFLKGMGLSPLEIKSVCLCIEATRMPQSPSNRIAMILCDADMWHLSSINFFCGLKQLRSEWEVALGIVFTDREWYGVNRDFLHEHTYFTAHAKDVWQQEKKKNIEELDRLVSYCCKK